MILHNKYSVVYYKIIEHARLYPFSGYTERHHILPKSLGGTNKQDNIVKLSARQHYICHRLLTKFTTGIELRKMSYALWRLCNSGKYGITSKTYEFIRVNHAEAVRRHKQGAKRAPFTQKCKDNMSKSHMGDKNYMFGRRHSPDSIHKMSVNRQNKCTGSTNPAYDDTVYTFYHNTYGIVSCTKHELCIRYNLHRSNINLIVKSESRSCKGWKRIHETNT